MRRYYCSMFLPSLARVCASWSHTRRSPGTLWYAFTDCTAALCCLSPPTLPPPPSESLIRLRCSATRCVYSLAAPPALILVCAPRSCFHFYTSLEAPPCARWGEICIFMWLRISYCTRGVFEGRVNRAGWKARHGADGRFSGSDDPANYLGTNDYVACTVLRPCSGVLGARAS